MRRLSRRDRRRRRGNRGDEGAIASGSPGIDPVTDAVGNHDKDWTVSAAESPTVAAYWDTASPPAAAWTETCHDSRDRWA